MGKGITGQLQFRTYAKATNRHLQVCRSPFGVRHARHQHQCWPTVRAENNDKAEGPSKDLEDAEKRLEALEASAVKRKTVENVPGNMSEMPETTWSDWKEGELLPAKWDELNIIERAAELYMGKRGALFWLNKAAFASVLTIGVLWIVFRFVGPQLGLYDLRSTISDVPL